MNDSIDFTPRENFLISLFKSPDTLFRRTVTRTLAQVLISVAPVGYYFATGEILWALIGYGVLLFQALYRLVVIKRGVQSMSSIIRKYEAQLQKIHGDPGV